VGWGERPPAFRREGAVRVQNAAANGSSLWLRVHKGDQLAKRVLLEKRIRVQDEQVAPLCLSYSLIVGACETNIFLVRNQASVWKPAPDHLRGSIDRIVVDDKRLDRQFPAGALDRSERLLQKLADVVVHDDHRDVNRRGDRAGLELGR